jgi:hypothetical protein
MKSIYKDRAAAETSRFMGEDRLNAKKPVVEWDVSVLLKLMWESWNDVFRLTLGYTERSLVSELRDHRNKWAHHEAFSRSKVLQPAISSPGEKWSLRTRMWPLAAISRPMRWRPRFLLALRITWFGLSPRTAIP